MSDMYDDILNMPHHESKVRKRMPSGNRAAQFAPFAALTGYEDAIEETGRTTTKKKEIDESLKEEINAKLNFIAHTKSNIPDVSITYFVPDERKAGGEYVKRIGTVTKVDSYKKTVLLDGREIRIEDIIFVDWIKNELN